MINHGELHNATHLCFMAGSLDHLVLQLRLVDTEQYKLHHFAGFLRAALRVKKVERFVRQGE